jgi:hypothetical protein
MTVKKLDTSKAAAATIASRFYALLDCLENGAEEKVSSEWKKFKTSLPARDSSILQKIFSIRTALQKGMQPEDLDLSQVADLPRWQEGELFFTRGLLEFHHQHFFEGKHFFEGAARCFQEARFQDRELISLYNAYIGNLNASLFANPEEELQALFEIQQKCNRALRTSQNELGRIKIQKTEALVLRDRAAIFQLLNKHQAAKEEILEAIEKFQFTGSKADLYLAYLICAEVCVDLKEQAAAETYFQKVHPPFEARVAFPAAYLDWLLHGTTFKKENFDLIPPSWLDRWNVRTASVEAKDELPIWSWDQGKGKILGPKGNSFSLKPSSIEGKLIKLLIQGRASKNLLCQSLWPEQGNWTLLVNRLHNMIHRMNKKYGNFIQFDGQFYSLKVNIRTTVL